MEWTKEIKDKIEKLDNKYASIGQDLPAYLDGLLYANPLHYWDYTYVDTYSVFSIPKPTFQTNRFLLFTIKLRSYTLS